MTHFTRYPTTPQTQMRQISAAYQLAGVTEPNRALEISKLIEDTPTTEQVTNQLALAALTATNAQKFYTDALAKIRDAQAADAFRAKFAGRLQEHSNNNMRDTLARVVDDLTPAFNALAQQIGTAAQKLPTANPLDVNANVENDSATEYKTVRDGLSKLSAYLSIHVGSVAQDLPRELNSILPLVALPTATVELVEGIARHPVNEQHLAGTRTIRALADAATTDLDAALVGVARGDYDGVTLDLATPDELRARAANARVAYTSTLAENANTMMVR